jgi:hypothetical protein
MAVMFITHCSTVRKFFGISCCHCYCSLWSVIVLAVIRNKHIGGYDQENTIYLILCVCVCVCVCVYVCTHTHTQVLEHTCVKRAVYCLQSDISYTLFARAFSFSDASMSCMYVSCTLDAMLFPLRKN